MSEVLTVLAFLLCLLLVIAACIIWPVVEAVRERQRVEQEVRFAEWRMRHVAQATMQRLLEEARQRS